MLELVNVTELKDSMFCSKVPCKLPVSTAWTVGGFSGDSPCSRTSLRERLSKDRRASRGAWSFLTRSHRSSVRSSRPVCPSSSYKHQHMTKHLMVNIRNSCKRLVSIIIQFLWTVKANLTVHFIYIISFYVQTRGCIFFKRLRFNLWMCLNSIFSVYPVRSFSSFFFFRVNCAIRTCYHHGNCCCRHVVRDFMSADLTSAVLSSFVRRVNAEFMAHRVTPRCISCHLLSYHGCCLFCSPLELKSQHENTDTVCSLHCNSIFQRDSPFVCSRTFEQIWV